MSSSLHNDNKGKDILILDQGPTQGLDDDTLTAEVKYPLNFTQSERRFVLSLHYNGSDRFLFVDATKIYQFDAKDLEIKKNSLRLGNIWKDFTIDNMRKTRLKESVNFFSVDYRSINTDEILDIYRNLMKDCYKIMFGII